MNFVDEMRSRCRERPRRIVFPEGEEIRTQKAMVTIQNERLLHPVLLGDRSRIAEGLRQVGADPDAVEIFDPALDDGYESYVETLLELRRSRGMTRQEAQERARSSLICGALMVRLGKVDGSVAGADSSTADVLRAALSCVGPAAGIRTVSSAFYMVVGPFRAAGHEVLTFTDCAVVPEPTGPQLADIALAAAEARRRIVGDSPKVAFLSYSTKGSAEGASVARVREALALFQKIAPGVPADGEMQVDAALLEAVSLRKAPDSVLRGGANVLVFPNLDAGNIGYKLVERLGGGEAIGPVVQGLRKPCNDLSRGASPADIVNVACATSLMAD